MFKKLIFHFQMKKVYKFFHMFHVLTLRRKIIKHHEIQRKSKYYTRTARFLSEEKNIRRLSEFNMNAPVSIETFIAQALSFSDFCAHLNETIDLYASKSQEYLLELTKIKENPEDESLNNRIKDLYQDTQEYVEIGSKKRLPIFTKFLHYRYTTKEYIYLWDQIKKNYFECVKVEQKITSLKDKYITNLIFEDIIRYNSNSVFITGKNIQSENIWDMEAIKNAILFLTEPIQTAHSHNLDFLNNRIARKYLEFQKLKGKYASIDKPFYLTEVIDQLVTVEDVPKEKIDSFIEMYQSDGDDNYERLIYSKLMKKLGIGCKILTNLYLETQIEKMPFSQIDMILFYEGNIYVLELKDYSGKIYGSQNSPTWKQILISHYSYRNSYKRYTNVNKETFQNPIIQNEGHIRILRKYYDFPYDNIVLFSGNSELNITARNVFVYNEFLDYIKKHPARDSSIADEIYYRLSLLNKGNYSQVKSTHIRSIKMSHGD